MCSHHAIISADSSEWPARRRTAGHTAGAAPYVQYWAFLFLFSNSTFRLL